MGYSPVKWQPSKIGATLKSGLWFGLMLNVPVNNFSVMLGRREAQLHLTEELGNCRMKVNGLTVWTWYPCCDGVDSGDMIVSY